VHARVGGTASHTLHATTTYHPPATAKPTMARCEMISRRDWYVPRSVCFGYAGARTPCERRNGGDCRGNRDRCTYPTRLIAER
jgi:hypothetical protein